MGRLLQVPPISHFHSKWFVSCSNCLLSSIFFDVNLSKFQRCNSIMLWQRFLTMSVLIGLQEAKNKNASTETSMHLLKVTEMYDEYLAYYDCKAGLSRLISSCLLLIHKLMTDSDFASESLPVWLPLCRFEKFSRISIFNGEVGTIQFISWIKKYAYIVSHLVFEAHL